MEPRIGPPGAALGLRRPDPGYPAATDTDPAALAARLADDVADGRVVLFTGAGFATDARARDGRPLPSTAELAELLWPVAFPDCEPDGSDLEDVFECALAGDVDEAGRVLRERLVVDERSLPDEYRLWFSAPWFRHYTLNVDDLDEAVPRRFDLPVPLRPLSALTDELPSRTPEVLSVHLNGRIGGFPAITFSHQQYGQRTALPDPWYQHLAMDLSTHPVLFVGTRLNEPPLWQQLALRRETGRMGRSGRERPPSYLVSPSLPRARRRVLAELGIKWVAMDQASFATEVLGRLPVDGARVGPLPMERHPDHDQPAEGGRETVDKQLAEQEEQDEGAAGEGAAGEVAASPSPS